MSAIPVAAAPRRAPATPTRHLEIAPSRSQRRARPRVVHVVVVLAGLVAILLAQLGFSIALADGAYRISALQIEQRDLLRQGQALGESLESLRAPQHLARSAEALGMVASGSLPYIDLTTGDVTGSAGETGAGILAAQGDLVPNTTIAGLESAGASSAVEPEGQGVPPSSPAPGVVPVSGVPSSSGAESPVSSAPGTIPSPMTR